VLFDPGNGLGMTASATFSQQKSTTSETKSPKEQPVSSSSIDKQTGTIRPSFTMSPSRRGLIDRSRLEHLHTTIKTWELVDRELGGE
jgi:hypothetical protein